MNRLINNLARINSPFNNSTSDILKSSLNDSTYGSLTRTANLAHMSTINDLIPAGLLPPDSTFADIIDNHSARLTADLFSGTLASILPDITTRSFEDIVNSRLNDYGNLLGIPNSNNTLDAVTSKLDRTMQSIIGDSSFFNISIPIIAYCS